MVNTNKENLKPFTADNAKTNGAKGGRASGEARREKKKIKDIISELMEQEASAMDKWGLNYDMDFISNRAVVAMKILDKAKTGDARTVKLLLELLGELERNTVKVDVNGNIEDNELFQKGYKAGQADVFKSMTDEELVKFMERMENNEELPEGEKPVILDDGTVIYGESQLK